MVNVGVRVKILFNVFFVDMDFTKLGEYKSGGK